MPRTQFVRLRAAGMLAASFTYESPPLKNPCMISFGIARCTWKCRTARHNTRWKVGISRAPAIVARLAEISSQRKSPSSA